MITEEMKKYASEAIDYASKFMPEPDEEFHSNEICLAVYVTSLAHILIALSDNIGSQQFFDCEDCRAAENCPCLVTVGGDACIELRKKHRAGA